MPIKLHYMSRCPYTKFYFTLALSTDCTAIFKVLIIDFNCLTADK